MNNRSVSRRWFCGAAGIAAAGSAMALAGCGGSSSGSAQTGDSASGTVDLTKLKFVLDYTPNTNHTGI